MDNRFFNSYPYTDFHELNLSWVISELRSFATTLEQFVSINALKYADPIDWNITTQYEKNTIVIDAQTGTAYISVAPVPSGVSLTNTDYWTVVFDLSMFIVRAAQNFTTRWEQDTTTTATFATSAGDWLVWGDVLYRAKVNITAGDAYVIDSNIEHFTMEDIIGHIADLSTTDKSNLVAAINEVLLTLQNTAGNLDNLTTTDKSNLVAAINEVLQTLINTAGDLADLNTIDKSNLVAAINEIVGEYDIIKSTKNLKLSFLGRYIRTDRFLSAQSMVCTSSNDIYCINIEYDTDDSIITHYTFDGTLISENEIGNTNHANGLTFDGSFLYIAGGSTIYKVDPVSLNIVDSLTPEVSCGNIAFENGYFYTFDKNNELIYKLNSDFTINSYITLPSMAGHIDPNWSQDCEMHNGIFYIIQSNPNVAIAVNYDSGEAAGNLYFDELMDEYYPIGEIQSLSFYDGDNFLCNGKARGYDPFENGVYHDYGEGQCGFGCGNLHNNIIQNRPNNHGFISPNLSHNINVDANSTAFRPDGSGTYPFKTLPEMAICINNYTQPLYITLKSDFDDDLILNNLSGVDIYNSPTRTIKNLHLMNCGVTVSGLQCDGNIHIKNTELCAYLLSTVTDTAATYIIDNSILRGDAAFIKGNKYSLNAGSYVTRFKNNAAVTLLETAGPGSTEYSTGKAVQLSDAYTNYQLLTFELKASTGRIMNSQTIPSVDLRVANWLYLFGYSNVSLTDQWTILIESDINNDTDLVLYSDKAIASVILTIKGINPLW